MSKIALEGNASGTGTFTVAAPNSNSNYTLTLPTETGTVLTNSGNQTGTFAALTVNGNNISADNSLGFRNRIINGDMRIAQRGTAAVTTDGAFAVDRFVTQFSTDGAYSAQQDSSAPAGFVNSIKFTTTTADASLGATQYIYVRQKIEGTNVSDLAWGTANAKTVTLSFWVRSSLTGTFGGALWNSAFDRSYPFTYTISSADTWEQKSVTIAGDTTGTWLTTTGIGINVGFGLGSGSTYSGTAGAWAAAGYITATGAVSVIGTLNATWYITGVQFEVGSVATPFERRDYGRELMLCQRYYQKLNGSLATYSATGEANANFYRHLVQMRSAPTVTVTTSPTYTNASSLTNDENSVTGSRFYVIVTATGRAFATDFVYACSSEL